MANNKNNDKKNTQGPESVICGKLKVLRNEKETARSLTKALLTQQKAKETVRAYKICCLDKAEQSNDFYQDIYTCITLSNYKKATIVQQKVDDYIKKDGEIEKLIKESSSQINELRIQIEEAHNEACSMSNCVKNKLLPKKGKSSKGDNTDKIEDGLKDILSITKTLDEKGQNAFDSMVTLAGIQTFTNTEGLKQFVADFVEKINTFKSSIEASVKTTGEEVIDFRGKLNKIIEELAQINCDKQVQDSMANAMTEIIEFICESDCDGECLDLCKEIKNCFDRNGSNRDRKPDMAGSMGQDQY